MSENLKIPELRFNGFHDEWAEWELKDIVNVCSGKDYKHLLSGDIPVYGTGGYMLSVNEFLSNIDSIGIGRKGTIDKPYILEAPFWTVDTLFYSVPRKDNDLNFVYGLFQNIEWKKKDESTGLPSLSRLAINSTKSFSPSFLEQTKIGTFFQQLDNRITLQQRKCDKLKNIKKSMLEKMFPKEGSNVPEIRFAGFTEPWEEKTLYSMVDSIDTGKSSFIAGKEKTDNNLYAILGSRNIIGYDSEYDYSGNFILTARVGENAGKLYNYSGKVKISDNTVFIQSNNLNYIFYLITNYDLKKLSFGTGQPLIKSSELSNLKLLFPNKEDEQIKIGNYFRQLDSLISLQNTKLDKLKNIKKSFLEKMFV